MENINSAFLGTIFTLLGLVLTFFLNRILEKDKNKGILLLQIFNYRNQDIKEIYALLIKLRKYYELFIYEGNEFSEQENYMNFGPLIEIESFQTEIEKKEIFLKNEMREKLYSLISSMGIGCNFALNLHNNDVECRTDKETIVLHCREIVNEIENLLKYLRTEIQKI